MRYIFTILLLGVVLLANDIAIVKKISGEVYVHRDSKTIKIKQGNKLKARDTIITKDTGKIGIIFNDGTVLALGPNSILSIKQYIFKPNKNKFDFNIKLKKGLASFESGKIGKLSPKSVNFEVPEGTIGIRGTKFFVKVK